MLLSVPVNNLLVYSDVTSLLSSFVQACLEALPSGQEDNIAVLQWPRRMPFRCIAVHMTSHCVQAHEIPQLVKIKDVLKLTIIIYCGAADIESKLTSSTWC
jgi:hypothetical protein